MKELELIKIGEDESLDVINTTDDLGGYPKNVRRALRSMESGELSFDTLNEIAKKYNLDIVELRKKQGQELWSVVSKVSEPFALNVERDLGDEYHEVTDIADELAFQLRRIADGLDNHYDCLDFKYNLQDLADLADEFEYKDDNSVCVMCGDEYKGMYDRISTAYTNDDGVEHIIALMANEDTHFEE